MQISKLLARIIFIVAIVSYPGCSIPSKSLKETTLDDMSPIFTENQIEAVKSLDSDEQITKYLEDFWRQVDTLSGFRGNKIKTEYLKRLEYANAHFPDHRGWGRSDRKRIYLIYGPPHTIERTQYTEIPLGVSSIKSIEIWLYLAPSKNTSFRSYGDDIHPGQKRFIFGDIDGSGIFTILYSSENISNIDPRFYR
jgi:GWxTD domain-containing protein